MQECVQALAVALTRHACVQLTLDGQQQKFSQHSLTLVQPKRAEKSDSVFAEIRDSLTFFLHFCSVSNWQIRISPVNNEHQPTCSVRAAVTTNVRRQTAGRRGLFVFLFRW